MNQYLLLLREPVDAPWYSMSPAEMQTVLERYGAWARQMASEGRLKGGEKLEDGTGRLLDKLGTTDGPFAESKLIVSGFFLILAADYEEALALARTCPHVDFGTIEVRQIDPV